MSKIVDPDQLNQGTEVDYTAANRYVGLNVAGNLDDSSPGRNSGVTHRALYSFTKEEWLATSALQMLPFPFDPIFEEKYEWINDWQPEDQQSIDLIRDAGLRIVLLNDEYACIVGLQNLDADTDPSYYHRDSGNPFTGTAQSFDKTGDLNEPWLIFDGTNDYRDFFKIFTRVQGKTYAYGDLLVDQGLSEITYQAYRIPMSNADDPNVLESDANIDSQTPYTNMSIDFLKGALFETAAVQSYSVGDVVQDGAGRWAFCTSAGTMDAAGAADYTNNGGTASWEAYAGEEQIGSNYYAFNRIVDVSTGTATAQEFYEWLQRQLRKTSDINADTLGSPNQNGFGTMDGEFAMETAFYEGSTLVTQPGLLIRNFDANDTNAIVFQDITVDGGGLDQDYIPLTSTRRTYPYVAAGTLQFNDFLVDEPDVDTFFTMFFQRTTRDTGTDIAVTSASGATATLTSSTTDFTTNFANGDYLRISGMPLSEDNGLFQVNGAVSANSMPVRKVNGESLTDQSAGPTVNLDSDPYGSPDAVIVEDNTATDITGQITSSEIAFSFDYDGNVQGGRTSGEDAPVVVYAQGLEGAQWVQGSFTITRSVGQTFPLNANQERVYLNP